MLVLHVENKPVGDGQDHLRPDSSIKYEYHIGAGRIPSEVIEKVTWITADGHELDYIHDQISGVPMAEGRVVKWFGDDAKFIAYNLKL